MLDLVFPSARQFCISRNYHRALGLGLREYIRKERLRTAFCSRSDLRTTLETGEIWTMRSDDLRASSSFVGLLRAVGRDVPDDFEGVTPPLPRNDYGLVLSYDTSQSRPWRLEYRAEQRNDLKVLWGLTFRAVLQRALELDCERALSISQSFAAMDCEYDVVRVVH